MAIGIAAIEYELPSRRTTLADLEAIGLLESGAGTLSTFGFRDVFISDTAAEDLAIRAGRKLLDAHRTSPESIDAVFYAGALPASHTISRNGQAANALDGFNYPVAKLQYELGLLQAHAVGIGQVGCMGLMTAVRAARDFLMANPAAGRALCVSADVLPQGAGREILYNVISDGACAALVARDAPRNRIRLVHQITKGYYWDCTSRRHEIVAAYFPTARHIVSETLARAGLRLDEIDWIIPHNVSLRSWEILLGLLGIPREKLWADNIACKGHVIAADNFINLKDAADAGRLRSGDTLLLFNFGFGANWGCLVLEH